MTDPLSLTERLLICTYIHRFGCKFVENARAMASEQPQHADMLETSMIAVAGACLRLSVNIEKGDHIPDPEVTNDTSDSN